MTRILLLPLLAVLLVGYQNCGGNMQAVVSSEWIANSPTGGFRTDFLDGLPAGISQSGKAFVRDPGSDAGNAALPFSTNLSKYGTLTTVKHLQNLPYLSNTYINFDLDTTYDTKIASPSTSLVYAPTDPRFQQVNAYLHIDTMIADMAGMNMFPPSYEPISVDAHCTDAEDNAYFAYEDNLLCMGYSIVNGKNIWASDDQDVTIHEFGHSLNHAFSTTDILTSTPDLGAVDEGFADLWSYRQSLDPKVSVWFGRAIYASVGQSVTALRNLSAVTKYPEALVDEVHDDASFLSGAVYQIEKDANVSNLNKTRLEKRMLESLQYGHGLHDAIIALRDEADDLKIPESTVINALTARGLYRNDLATEVQLNATQPAYPIDTYRYPSIQKNGNCNGALDAGETLILYPNLENVGAIKGGIALELTTSTPNVSVSPSGNFGFMYRLKGSDSFRVAELAGLDRTKSTYWDRMLAPSFLVEATASASGTATFTLKITTMNTIGTTANTRDLVFTLPIGSVGPSAACSSTSVLP